MLELFPSVMYNSSTRGRFTWEPCGHLVVQPPPTRRSHETRFEERREEFHTSNGYGGTLNRDDLNQRVTLNRAYGYHGNGWLRILYRVSARHCQIYISSVVISEKTADINSHKCALVRNDL